MAAILTGMMGLANLIAAVNPILITRLRQVERFFPLEVRHGSRLTAALAGFALLLMAGNLWRRKRVAWMITLAVLVISVISHLLLGFQWELALVAGALALWLATLRSDFHARSDRPSIRNGLLVLALAIFFTLAYGAAGFYLQDREYSIRFNLWQAIQQTVIMFTQFYDPGLHPLTRFSRFFADSIYVIGAVTFGYALVMLARPVLLRQNATDEERSHARLIVQAHGRSPLARLCLLPDKSYYFSPGGSVVAYTVKGRVALALGDPIGPESDFRSVVAGFKRFCEQNDWMPAFYQVAPGGLSAYNSEGLQSLKIGREAIIHLDTFTLEGSQKKALRNAYHRIERMGYEADLTLPPQSPERLAELRSVSDEWLTQMHGTEMRFSVGWFDDEYIHSCPVMAVCSPDHKISAFASILEEYQKEEISIDLMRRRTVIENGVMEFLFVSIIQWARSQGCATFSLGLSALSGVGEHDEDPAVERALHTIYEHVNQFYNFRGLHEFKEKFQPEWSPRYLIYPNPTALPAVAIALARADSGDDFIVSYLKG
jgi:phosphatidylglycerol lysyltransferase